MSPGGASRVGLVLLSLSGLCVGLGGCVGPGLEPPGRPQQAAAGSAAGGTGGNFGSAGNIANGSAGAGAGTGNAGTGDGTGTQNPKLTDAGATPTVLDHDGGTDDDAGATHP